MRILKSVRYNTIPVVETPELPVLQCLSTPSWALEAVKISLLDKVCLSPSNLLLHCHLEDGLQASTSSRLDLIFGSRISTFNDDFASMTRYSTVYCLSHTYVTAKAGVRDLIHCRTPSPSWYHLKEKLRQSRMKASLLLKLEAGIAPAFHACAACPTDRESMICFQSTRNDRTARADPWHQSREVSSTWNIVHRLCLLPLLLLLATGALAL